MMKKRKHIIKFKLLFLFTIVCTAFLNANSYSHNQTIVKKYKVNRETIVYINNKYGKVHVGNWQNDSVKIEITLSIKSSSYTRVYKLKENIDFDFVKTKYNISATTVFGSRYNSFFSDLKDLAESFVSTENQVTIDYFIQVPIWINIDITNKYGDVFIDDAEGEVSINISNGELKANKLLGTSYVTLNTGGADIYDIKDGKLNINWGDLNIKSAEKVDITSNKCNGRLADIDYLRLNSKRDEFYITSVNRILGDMYFSDLKVSELETEVSLDMKYGSFYLDQLSETFSFINLTSEYTDVDILFNRDMSYNFDMTHFNDITFYYPKDLSKLQEKLVDEDASEYLVYGTIGPAQSPKAKVNIKAYKKCYIRIEHK